jgi:predicted Ser/Thr protein kinase
MKTAYATIKGIEVMRALRKGQASSFYYGQPQGEIIARKFENESVRTDSFYL